ncbi:hypothetical protein DL96DRAFT_172843 [Flagelloscypha sp. PMI_526]|nr:hypothetical protein DL96DRAFT_172843 [Flagelloscypha sp. PMI_526]
MLDGHTPKPSLEIPHNGSLNSLHGSSLYIGEIRPPSPRSSVGSSWGSPSKPRHTTAQHPRSLNSRKDHPTNLLELNIPPHQPRHFHPTGHTFSGDRSYNYEEKYAQDAPGEEAGQSARVWKTYLDEAESYDDDMLKGFQDTINSLLVLAALFSAVVTTFVIETSQLLRTDYGQVTATLLYEQVQLLRANGNATLLSSVPVSTVNPNSQTWSTTDIVVNGLFFTSLALSLATALLSVLSKQWIQAYTALTSGTAMDRALIRHFRFEGVLKWKLTEFIGSLPLLLHTSLALFLAGLALFVYNLHSSLSWTVSVIAALSFLFYLGSLFLPVLWIDCPFKVPLLYRPMAWIIFAFQYLRYTFKKRFASSKTYVKPPRPAFSTLKEAELEILSRSRSYDVTELALKSISWLHGLTSNNTCLTGPS